MTEIKQADRDAAKAAVFAISLPEAFARHRMEERAAIVAWLRGDDPYPDGHDIADAIEAGEHLK